jgi:hypothetical protein
MRQRLVMSPNDASRGWGRSRRYRCDGGPHGSTVRSGCLTSSVGAVPSSAATRRRTGSHCWGRGLDGSFLVLPGQNMAAVAGKDPAQPCVCSELHPKHDLIDLACPERLIGVDSIV